MGPVLPAESGYGGQWSMAQLDAQITGPTWTKNAKSPSRMPVREGLKA
jgi:hypothetical protein